MLKVNEGDERVEALRDLETVVVLEFDEVNFTWRQRYDLTVLGNSFLSYFLITVYFKHGESHIEIIFHFIIFNSKDFEDIFFSFIEILHHKKRVEYRGGEVRHQVLVLSWLIIHLVPLCVNYRVNLEGVG